MNKEDCIAKNGEEGYKKHLAQCALWDREHPVSALARSHARNRKGGKFYEE